MINRTFSSSAGSSMDFTVFEATPGKRVVFLPDPPHFTIVAASKDMCRFVGLSKEQIVRKSVFDAFPANPADPDFTGHKNLRASLMYVIEHKTEHQMEMQRYDMAVAEGAFKEIYWQNRSTPVLNEEGAVIYIIHTPEDITDQVRAQETKERMKGIEREYNLFLQVPMVIGILRGKDYILELANESALQLWDKTTDIIGKPLLEAIPEFKGQWAYGKIDQVFKTGIPYRATEVAVTSIKEGKEVVHYFDLYYQPYYDEGSSTVSGVFTLSNDVTEKVLAEKKMKESEEKYRTVFETMDQGFCIVELIFDTDNKPVDYRFVEINPVFEKQTGLKEAAGKTARDLVPNLESRWFDLYGNVALTGEAIRFVEGSEAMGRWFEVYAFRIGGDDSRKVALLFTDISERRKAEEAIKQSEQNLRNTILQAPVAMCILRGSRFVVEIANDRMYELWGRSKEELLHKSIFEGLPEVRDQGYEELLNGVFTTGKTFSAHGIPVTLPRSGGLETVYINLLYEAFREGDGTVSGVIAVATDVTEQVVTNRKIEELVVARTRELAQANEALNLSNAELKRSNANLEEFAHAASHDLKEPIRKIHFFTDRLKLQLEDRITQEEKLTFTRIENASQRMGALIDDLLLYSHVSQRPHQKEDVDLNEKLKKVLEDLELDIQQKGAVIKYGTLPVVKGYHRQLQQLFQNLIGNALKYNKPGVAPQIAITSTAVTGVEAGIISETGVANTFHLIEVTDNGIGFEQENAERIFQMFQRLHGNTEYRGTGVGLSIARKVVENHNGKIVAEGSPGEGAVFKVYLPAFLGKPGT